MNSLKLAHATYTGNYEPIGSPDEADSVIALSFGYRWGQESAKITSGPINETLAAFTARYTLPVIAQQEIAETGLIPKRLISGVVTEHREKGYYLNTEEFLAQVREILGGLALKNSILVAQAYHVTSVRLQAEELGINIVIPEGLPKEWDSASAQWWTRSPSLFILYAAKAKLLNRHG